MWGNQMLVSRIVKTLGIIERLILRLYRGYRRRALLQTIEYGADCNISDDLYVKYPENVCMGSSVNISPGVTIGAFNNVHISDGVTISQDVLIETAGLAKSTRTHIGRPIKIGKGAWVGSRAIILAGAEIGDNAVIGAGAAVRTHVAENTVYTGSNRD
jgi:acetyltransferase-like isoleucine patch superfamily enzyme